MKNAVTGALLLAATAAGAPLAAQSECEATRNLSTVVDAAGATSVTLLARAGSLEVRGRQGLAQVRVNATACASDADLLDEIELIAERRGAEAYVEVGIGPDLGRREYARVDLVIEVPASAELDVTDGSGSVDIADVSGGLTLQDGSGEISIRNAAGAIVIRDGSGEIEVDEVDGSVTIEEDGSGTIDIRDVDGDVAVRRDGSGGIDVERVSGSFTVGRDGSGGVDFANIGGAVSVPDR